MTNNIPKVIQKIIAKLGLKNSEDIQDFLSPRLDLLPHPLQMKGMAAAVKIIQKGIEQGTDIIIWGDYDVDGTTATSLLINFFRELGIEVHWHIPNRLQDGYGLSSSKFLEIHQSLESVEFILITVDCGISNSKEVAEILRLGGQVIVTDHHQLPIGGIPGCVVLNPNQDGCGFAQHKLAGVGVAFYLAAAIRASLEKTGYFRELAKPNMKEYLGFVALGTISDLVEITQTNRVLVRAGMEVLVKSNIPGIDTLIDSVGLKGGPLTTEDISFSLGPRINAAGRLGAADAAVQLMTCDNRSTGIQLSKKLGSYNEHRKTLCAQNLDTALNIIDRSLLNRHSVVVVAGHFHIGIMGIVASKIVDIYKKPTIIFSQDCNDTPEGPVLKGSGRSVPGINLLECLHMCATDIEKYGGHAMAAGLTVKSEKYERFVRLLDQQISIVQLNAKHLHTEDNQLITCSIDDIMHRDALEYLLKLEPFGPENERPVFVDEKVSVVNCKTIGANNQHLQLTVRGKYENYRGVGFGLGERHGDVRLNPERRMAFSPMINRYRGGVDWQLRVVEI